MSIGIDLPEWAADLSVDELDAIRAENFPGTSFYSYAAGLRQLSVKRALEIADMRRALDKPPALHLLRPDVWGAEDTGPE